MTIYDIIQYGALGDGKTDDAGAIQKAIDSCTAAGGGRVLVPAGYTFSCGPFKLKSNVELHIEIGATLKAIPEESAYTESAFRNNKGEGTIWIGGNEAENILITGGGTVDGNGMVFMGAEQPDAYILKPFDEVDPRPHLLTLVACKKLKIRDVTFQNAAYWGLHFIGCKDVSILGISIYNSLKIRNSDGIDLDHCENVNITNCHIESGDDCICLKNRREYKEFGPCKDITISGCTLVSTSCAIKIGSENVDEIRQIIINNCIIKNSNRGIGIQHRDEGSVSDIIISNIIIECRLFSDVWWGKAEPIYITAFPRSAEDHKDAGWRLPAEENKGRVGQVKNITFNNIRCKSENGVFIAAESQDRITNIRFNSIAIEINKVTDFQGGIYDCRPCAGEDMLVGNTSGFYLRSVGKIFIQFCDVEWGDNRPEYFNKAINANKVECLVVDNFTGEAAFPAKEDPILISESGWIFNQNGKM